MTAEGPLPTIVDHIVNDLSAQGYSVSEGLVSDDLIAALAEAARTRQAQGRLNPARTGKARAENEMLRGDSIAWLDEHSDETAIMECMALFEGLRTSLNEQLFMNLHEVESHFAIYPPGAVYQKHLDQFSTGDQSRQLSLVLYLNDGWVTADGGALRLYLDDAGEEHVDIAPASGRLVLFLSSRFWHEVLPATRERLSLTGWFRTRSLF